MAVRPDSTTQTDSELEQYGVWVKAEPHDIAEEPSTKDVGASEFDLPSDTPALPEDSFLTEDEKKIIGSFNEIETGAGSKPGTEEAKASSDLEDLPPLEDFETGPAESDISPNVELDMDKIQGLDSSADALSAPESAAVPEAPADVPAALPEKEASTGAQGPGELEDVSAEFLDVLDEKEEPKADKKAEAKAEPEEEFSLPQIDDFAAPAAEEAPKAEAQTAEAGNEPPLDIDLSFDDTLGQPKEKAAGTVSEANGFEEVSEFDDFLKDENEKQPKAEAEKKTESPAEKPDAGFDDIAALTEELATPVEEPAPLAEAAVAEPVQAKAAPEAAPAVKAESKSEAGGLANDLLLQIANELSSIRGELVNLKGELATIKKEEEEKAPAVSAAAEAGKEQEEKTPAKDKTDKHGGFFDEEEDETIALTGDELDNILNTADFTEEAAPESTEAAPEAAESEPAPAGSEDLGGETLLPESGEYDSTVSAAEPAGEPEAETAVSASDAGKAPEPEETPGFEEIAGIADAVEPMTPPPEDTSYLEVPLEDSDDKGPDLGDAPIHEEPLVEPDLSGFNLEEEAGPVEEISEELPVIEGPAENESSPESLADMTLGMQAAPDYMPEAAAEPLAAEPIPEVEPSSFEELELAGESNLPSEEAEELNPLEGGEPEALAAEPEALDLGGESIEENISSGEASDMVPLAEETPTAIEEQAAPAEASVETESIDLSPIEEVEAVQPEPEALPEQQESAPIQEQPKTDRAAPEPAAPKAAAPAPSKASAPAKAATAEDEKLKGEIRGVLSYLDKLLESLPEDKIEEFAKSEYFDTYKKLFEELGLV